jgi:hypothetical protein
MNVHPYNTVCHDTTRHDNHFSHEIVPHKKLKFGLRYSMNSFEEVFL